jgi:carbon storage regulator
MLVLSRKKGEAINIADGVTITVREITGSRVVLGFEAPSDVRIMRQELPLRVSTQAALGTPRSELKAGVSVM